MKWMAVVGAVLLLAGCSTPSDRPSDSAPPAPAPVTAQTPTAVIKAAGPCLGQAAPRAVFLGDSTTQGTHWVGGESGSWVVQFSAKCGWTDVFNEGKGSTGAIADKGSGNYVARIGDVARHDPTVVFVSGYYNDRTFTPDQIGAAWGHVIDGLQALPGNPRVVVTGAYDPAGYNGGTYKNIDATIRPQCQQRGVPYVEPSSGKVYGPTGVVVFDGGPWITAENKGRYISPDGVHQSADGQAYMAQRMFDAVQVLSPVAIG